MRNKIIIILAGALLLQCCCLSGLLPEMGDTLTELESELGLQMTLEVLEMEPTLAVENPAPIVPTSPPLVEELPDDPADFAGDAVVGSATYRVQQTLTLANDGNGTVDEIKLHMALLKSWKPYQVVTLTKATPANYETFSDEFGNQYGLFWLYDIAPGESVPIVIEYEVTVNALDYDLGACSGEMFNGFTYAEKYLEVDHNDIASQSYALTENVGSYCQAARNIYDYVMDSLVYAGYVTDDAGALKALNSGTGDCTEYSDLMIALSRAAGVPARFVEGITYGREGFYDAGQTKHDWLEVFLPGSGWVPMDPTWGENNPDGYFAEMSPDHIVVTKGRNLAPLNGYHYWVYWSQGDDSAEVNTYDEAWKIWKQ